MKTHILTNKTLLTLSLLGSMVFTPKAYAGKGMLTISTNPGGAKIYINGKRKGTSPKEKGQSLAIKLDEGEYTVTAYGKSYSPLWVRMGTEEVFVGADSHQLLTIKVTWQLNPELPKAHIQRMKELMTITDNNLSKSDRKKDFIPQGNGTVIDKRTGLQWMRCSLGQKWTGSSCSGEPNKYTREQAIQLSKTYAGNSDWRLPTRFELETLVYCSSGKGKGRKGEHKKFDMDGCDGNYQGPTIVQKVFPNTVGSDKHPSYWSSSPNAGNDNYAWVVNFYYGYDYSDNKLLNNYVRLVRGGQ